MIKYIEWLLVIHNLTKILNTFCDGNGGDFFLSINSEKALQRTYWASFQKIMCGDALGKIVQLFLLCRSGALENR